MASFTIDTDKVSIVSGVRKAPPRVHQTLQNTFFLVFMLYLLILEMEFSSNIPDLKKKSDVSAAGLKQEHKTKNCNTRLSRNAEKGISDLVFHD